ncbi:MAG: MATE family efflux transporter [bacterium]|nr:MATE family efflux transporter [bacterium]
MTLNPFQDRSPGGFREFFALAYPLVISHLSMALMHFVDRLFLSWSGAEEIAAALPAGILAFTLLAFFIGVSEFANSLVAQYHGANREEEASRAVWQGAIFALAAGVLCNAVTPWMLAILNHSGHSPRVIELEKLYFVWFWRGGFLLILNGALSSFYSGRGETRIVMYVNLAANCCNAFLDYALIFGAWGFPQWGIAGAAIATITASAMISLIYIVLIFSPANRRIRRSWIALRFDGAMMTRLIRFGAPSGFQMMMDVGAFTVFVFMLGRLGDLELAASNIVVTLNMLAFFPMLGAGIATGSLVGRYIGRNRRDIAEKSAYTALMTVETYMIVCALVYFLFPGVLIRLFLMETPADGAAYAAIYQYGTKILMFVAIYQVFDAMIITFSGALRGAGDTFFSMWISVFCVWLIFVPGEYFILVWLERGVMTAWGWATVYIALIGVIFMLRFRHGYWKTIELIQPEAQPEAAAAK